MDKPQATSGQSRRIAAAAAVHPILLTDEQGAALYGISVRRFHELRTQGLVPAAVVLGPRLLRWHLAELEAAVASMPRQRDTSEPAALARARIDRMKKSGVPE